MNWVCALGDALPSLMLKEMFPPWLPEEYKDRAPSYLAAFVQQAKPRDSLERMLLQQLVFAHVRATSLSVLACRYNGDWQCAERMHATVDKAMGTYGRGRLALQRYRAMQRPASVMQINQAEQQKIVCAGNLAPKT